jgi:urease accessory protein
MRARVPFAQDFTHKDNMNTKQRLVAAALFLGAIPAASAHPGHDGGTGLAAGFLHPLTGWDHLLAIVAVGLLAAQLRAPRLLPGVFLAAMGLGAAIGHWTGPVSGLEQGIAASVFVLGLLVALRARMPAAAGAAWVGAFALLHGAAHGAEMPASAGGLAYGCGFLAATALVLAAGVAAGNLSARLPARASRAPGWIVAAAGLALLALASK